MGTGDATRASTRGESMTRSEARRTAVDLAEQAIVGVIGAVERERARKRLEACSEKVFHALLARDGGRLMRPWHRMMTRRMNARCEANRYRIGEDGIKQDCPAVARMHRSMRERGLA